MYPYICKELEMETVRKTSFHGKYKKKDPGYIITMRLFLFSDSSKLINEFMRVCPLKECH
jgi:hypothetical protein